MPAYMISIMEVKMKMTGAKKFFYASILILPALLLFTFFLIVPIFQSLYLSFFSWRGISGEPLRFVGLNNFIKLFKRDEFWRSLGNSGWFMAGSFLVLMPVSIILALVITKEIRGKRFFKTSFFMPTILPLTAVGLMWSYILSPMIGPVNKILEVLGCSHLAKAWLGDPATAIFCVVLVSNWVWAGFNMLIFAAGMVSIPTEFYNAAVIDGANSIQKVWYITLPLLKESFKVFSVIAVTGSLRTFDLVFVMTGGGPNGATNVPASLLYYESFLYSNFGFGNSIGVFIMVSGMVLSVLINKLFREE